MFRGSYVNPWLGLPTMTLSRVSGIPEKGYCHALTCFGMREPNLSPITESSELWFAFNAFLRKTRDKIFQAPTYYFLVLWTWNSVFSHTEFNRFFLPRDWYRNKSHENGSTPKTLNISPPHPGCLQVFLLSKKIFLQTSDCAWVFQSEHVARYIEKHSENNFLIQINSPTLEL